MDWATIGAIVLGLLVLWRVINKVSETVNKVKKNIKKEK